MTIKTNEITEEIKTFLTRQFLFSFDGENINASTDLFDSGIIDSFGAVEMVNFIEKKFCIKISDDELLSDSIRSLDNLIKFIDRKIKDAGK